MKTISRFFAIAVLAAFASSSSFAQNKSEKAGAAARRGADKTQQAVQKAAPVVKEKVGTVVENAKTDIRKAAPVIKEKAAPAIKAVERAAADAGRDLRQAGQKTGKTIRDFATGWKKESDKIKQNR